MVRRRIGLLSAVTLALLVFASPASAQYYEDEGFFLFLDAIWTEPNDTDQVVATVRDGVFPLDNQTTTQVKTDWDSEPAGRLGFGYRWPSGSKIALVYWQFENDARTRGTGSEGGVTYFAIGPPIYDLYSDYPWYGSYATPGHWDIGSEIKASSAEVMWGRDHEFSESFAMDWALGLRYASFEESMDGIYDYLDPSSPYFGYYTYGVSKSNEGTMLGFKAAARGEYSFSEFLSIDSSLGFSLLQGEVKSASGLTPVGLCNTGDEFQCPGAIDLPSTQFKLDDDSRSGSIVDFDIRIVTHIANDRYRVWLGWEYSRWSGIVDDQTRNAATGGQGSSSPGFPLTRRNEIAFTGWKIGVAFRF